MAARANWSHRTFSFTLAQFGRHGRQWKVSHTKIHKEKMKLPRQNYREKENHDRDRVREIERTRVMVSERKRIMIDRKTVIIDRKTVIID